MIFKNFVFFFMLKLVSSKLIRNEVEVDCYATSDRDHKHFATKTAYEEIKDILPKAQYEVEGEDCKSARMWMLSRHGAVYPSQARMNELSKLVDLANSIVELSPPPGEMCTEDVELLQNWEWHENTPDDLSNEGHKEMKTLAAEYKEVFTSLLSSAENVLFRYSAEPKITDSFNEFASELFPGLSDVVSNTSNSETLFKFYEHCEIWKENKDNLYDSASQLSQFENSDLFITTVYDISVRLGLSDSKNLTAEDVKDIWDMCRFDKAWDNQKLSAWCSAFTQDHINVLEYHEDLKLFYMTGHGVEINSRLACDTVVDLIDHLTITENDAAPKVSVSFADATAFQLFLTALETHKDSSVEPSVSNMEGMDNRMWKSSEMSPFASNLAVVKYDCSGGEDKLKFFLNQKLLKLHWCENGLCTFSGFIEKYRSFKEADCSEYFCLESEISGKAKMVYGHGLCAMIAVSFVFMYLLLY